MEHNIVFAIILKQKFSEFYNNRNKNGYKIQGIFI